MKLCGFCHGSGWQNVGERISCKNCSTERIDEIRELHDTKTDMNKYRRYVRPDVFIDVYDVLDVFEVSNPAVAHAVKKLLAPGKRGFKSTIDDLKEAVVSINRGIELEEQNARKVE